MATKGTTTHNIDRYISGILYTLLFLAAYAFYHAAADVFDAIIEKDHAERWYNASGTLIVSLVAWVFLTFISERRNRLNPAIVPTDIVRKVVLAGTVTIFFTMPIYVIYYMLDRYLHGEYRLGFYGIQCLKLLTAGIIGSYFFLALRRHTYAKNAYVKKLGILLILEGLTLFAVNLYYAPSVDELRMQRKDEDRGYHLSRASRLVEDYLRQNKRVPKTLADITLSDSQREKAFKDPVTDKPFTYVWISENESAICAEFQTKTQDKYLDHTVHPITKNPNEKCKRIEKPKDEDNLRSLGS